MGDHLKTLASSFHEKLTEHNVQNEDSLPNELGRKN
jgi:hypothetical protein